MSKKTVVTELKESIKNKIPSAGTTESLRALQTELGRISYEIHADFLNKEKQQLRDAFNKGIVYGMLLATTKHDQSDNFNGFDRYFSDTYEE